jgi:carboxylate-amine ligase
VIFAESEFGTVGVEYEATIIDRQTSRPQRLASSIANETRPALTRGGICPDLFESTLEFVTGICTSIDEVRADLLAIHGTVQPVLDRHDATLLGMGLPAVPRSTEFDTTSAPRYRDIIESLQWPARRLMTNGIHVHIGMPSSDHALRTTQGLRSLLPVLLALSASSPFRNGEVTGLASTRMALWSAVPRSGPMPSFADMGEYEQYCQVMQRAAAIGAANELRWDCRLNAGLGTVEIRIADTVAEMEDTLALCAFAWCLAVGVEELHGFHLPTELSDENRWRAIRYGSQCEFIVDASGSVETLDVLTERIIDSLSGTAATLGCEAHLDRCRELASGRAPHQRLTSGEPGASARDLATAAELIMRVDW